MVRGALDALTAPWCPIVGDHDVLEKSLDSFRTFMSSETQCAFQIGHIRFLALNAFQVPDPGSFAIFPDQIQWITRELDSLHESQIAVLLLHCYPSDLKVGGTELKRLVDRPEVRLIDMGHTHYNEVANDGKTIYTATRSTGQIEEGSVGFSVTNVDGPVVSWKFFPLGRLPALMITSPADKRFITEQSAELLVAKDEIKVRVKVWCTASVNHVVATLGAKAIRLANIPESQVWEGSFIEDQLPPEGVHDLLVKMEDADGGTAEDVIHCVFGKSAYQATERKERDQDNALEAWPERGLLGTQLGPNKNGRKW